MSDVDLAAVKRRRNVMMIAKVAAAVPAIAQEEFYPQNTAKTLSALVKAKLVLLPGGARFPAESYLDHVKALAQALYVGLQP